MTNKAFKGIMAGIEDAVAYAEGDKSKGKAHVVAVPVVDVKKARAKTGLSQDRFAKVFGISLHTLRKWEQGQRRPQGPAKVLLAVIDKEPDAVMRCIVADWRDVERGSKNDRPLAGSRT
jgi:putative transcriptional regulator